MVPIKYQGDITIPIAIFSGWIQNLLTDYLPEIMTFIIVITFLGTLLAKLAKPAFIENSSFSRTYLMFPTSGLQRDLSALFLLLSPYFK